MLPPEPPPVVVPVDAGFEVAAPAGGHEGDRGEEQGDRHEPVALRCARWGFLRWGVRLMTTKTIEKIE